MSQEVNDRQASESEVELDGGVNQSPSGLRQVYVSPTFERIGTIEDLTLASNVAGSDGYTQSAGGG